MINESKAAKLEEAIRKRTRPINGQYPRPWITSSKDPASSEVFVVGMNDAKTFPASKVDSHDQFLDALFNRSGENCYNLFYRLTSGPYHTRNNIDNFIRILEKHGVTDVLSTNVICYSTPMSSDLRQDSHAGGATRGREIFRTVFEIIAPKIVIVQGSGSVKELSKVLKCPLPSPPAKIPAKPVEKNLGKTSVFVIPSLAPPQFNKWSLWAKRYLEDVSRAVAARLA